MVSVTRKAKAGGNTRRSEARVRLLRAMEQLLEDGRSFAEISVEDLITAAGVARSTFYACFEDKGALLLELAEHVTAEVEVAAARWYDLPPHATRGDLKEALRELMKAHLQHKLTLVAVVESASFDPRVRAEYEAVMSRRITAMTRAFRTQQRAGGIRADVDVDLVAPWIGWMTERGFFQLLKPNSVVTEGEIEGMTTLVWRVLYDGTHPS